MTHTLALNADWLGTTTAQTFTTTGDNVLSSTLLMPYGGYTYQSYPTYVYLTPSSPARPIKLTLSEVERLRKLARADEKVKAILAKFTDQIEITVDFD